MTPPSDLAALGGPADQVPEDLIPALAREAPGHWADFPGLYRRMTPPIVRLPATGRLHAGRGLIASRLLAAGWTDRASAGRGALEEAWRAWWRPALHEYPGTEPAAEVLEAISVSTGALAPWLAIWDETRTEPAGRHLHDTVDGWLAEGGIAGLRPGFYGELHATPELLPWLRSLGEDRIGAARLAELARIVSG